MKNYLNFELDIKDLENELEKLKDPYNKEGLSEVDTDKISKLQNEIDSNLKKIYILCGKKSLPISGAEKIHIATEKGESKVNCNIIDNLNDEEKGALDLRLLYQGSESCPITLGERFLGFREKFSITQQQLAKKTGITPGTIHHYESLIKTLAPSLKKNVMDVNLMNAEY